VRIGATTFVLCLLLAAPFSQASKKTIPAVRWTAGAPGCEFQRGDDGRYRWRMNGDDLDMTLIMDSQVLAQSRHRFYHVVSAYMTVTYTGQGKLEFPADLRLEFVRHHNVIQPGLDPDELANTLQNDIDTMIFDTERAIKKDPAKAEEKTARAREFQKEASEFIEFVSSQSLQPTTLTPGNPEVHGWVFFRTDKNKWIGPWKSPEDFILRVMMKEKVWEFPFSLPPAEGDFILRKREN
jgi:hypothetical protein